MHRRMIALAAAYVMGLQALLLPLSVAAGAFLADTLCTSGGVTTGPDVPPGHSDSGCACASCGMQCCAHAPAGPSHAVIAVGLSAAGYLLSAPAIDAAPRPAWHGPQLARAPPAA
jgi:hypothetical protein